MFRRLRDRIRWYRIWRRKRRAKIERLRAELEALYEEERTGPLPTDYYQRVWALQAELFILTGDPKDGHWAQ